jgi:hypothetical protein
VRAQWIPSLFVTMLSLCGALASLLPQAADAGYRDCPSRSLSRGDEQAVRREMKNTAGGLRIDWSSISFCKSSQHQGADVLTREVPQADGSVLHSWINCHRAKQQWTCERAESRSLVLPGFGDASEPLRLRLSDGFGVEDARVLFRQSLDRLPSLTIGQQCFSDYRYPNDPDGTKTMARLREELAPTSLSSVEFSMGKDGTLLAEFNDVVLTFVRQDAAFAFKCWYEQIIVT